MWPRRPRPSVKLACSAVLLALAASVLLAVALLAIVHVDDRYGVSAASGVWMGLTSALRDGVFYPPVYANGFYGGTRYTPLPFILESGVASATNELLVSAKLSIYAVAGSLYALLFFVARRRGAPRPVAIALIAAVLSTAAGSMTTLGIRWDALATLLQLAAVAILLDHEGSRRRATVSGVTCSLALAAKISAVWAPVTLVIWLAVLARRSLLWFLASFTVSLAALVLMFQVLSSGRFLVNVRLFAFGGSDFASAVDGAHRLYQFALRDQREAALLIVLAAVGVAIAVLRRRIGPYEIGFVATILVLLVVIRDAGAYENHLLDLVVLSAVVVAGLWHAFPPGRAATLIEGVVMVCVLGATLLAVRYTLLPDIRGALSHELRGRTDPRFALNPISGGPAIADCDLFEDATIPLLAGERPVVLDAFMVHRLQTRRPAQLDFLVERVRQSSFRRIVLTTSLDDIGWFYVLDFGSLLADVMRENYRLGLQLREQGLWIYVPKQEPPTPPPCRQVTLRQW